MPLRLEFSEEERQAMLLALAWLALSRPGWHFFLQSIAQKMDPELYMFQGFKRHNEDRAVQYSDGGPDAPSS